MNLTQKCLDEGADYDKLGEILIEMAEYALYHFKAEEDFMEKLDFPRIEKQRLAHQGFITKIEETQILLDGKKLEAIKIILKLNNYLQLWLIDHIQGMDKDIGIFYQDHAPIELENNYELKQEWVWDLLSRIQQSLKRSKRIFGKN